MCTFENGVLCALNQMVGDFSDWWLVNSTFVRLETKDSDFVDHTSGTEEGTDFFSNINFNISSELQYIYLHLENTLRNT